jgi:hypothetical protein
VGERLGTWKGLTGGVCEAGRERTRVEKKQRRQIGPTEQRERERGREGMRVGTDRQDLPVRHRGHAGIGLMGRLGRNWFSIFQGISN